MESEKQSQSHDERLEMRDTSKDAMTGSFLHYIKLDGKMGDVEQYLNEMVASPSEAYGSTEDFLADNPEYLAEINNRLTLEERSALKSYSGFRFPWINSVARGFWDTDKLGIKTPELEEEMKDTARKIISAIEKAPAPQKSFTTFRGTNLDSFRAYGVNDIADLASMKGQFMVEQGFTSTAIAEDQSFAKKDVGSLWIGKSNVEIQYHIPAGAENVIALASSELSYSPQQTEALINHNSLFYIKDVAIENEHAKIQMILIPSPVYESGPTTRQA